jgi:hypothetical protein
MDISNSAISDNVTTCGAVPIALVPGTALLDTADISFVL